MTKQIEITRHNVTPAQFLAYVRSQCKAKGIDECIDLEGLKNPNSNTHSRYTVKDGKKTSYCDGIKFVEDASEAPCKAEINISKPYSHQTYFVNWDGSIYNEICEFSFDDDGIKGTGYYYQISKDAEEAEEPKTEESAEQIEEQPSKIVYGEQIQNSCESLEIESVNKAYMDDS